MSAFQCKLCKIVHSTKIQTWSHLLEVHNAWQNSEDEGKDWEEIILLETDLRLSRLTEEDIRTATSRNKMQKAEELKLTKPIIKPRRYTPEENKAAGITLVPGPKRFKCIQCSQQFARRTNLLSHINSVHAKNLISGKCGQKRLRHLCPHCNVSFKAINLLEYHKLTHSPDWHTLTTEEQNRRQMDKRILFFEQATSTFECTRCQERFTNEEVYKSHCRSHDDKERPNKCRNCPAAYSKTSALTNHLKANKCDEFNQKALNRPYQCEICFTCVSTEKGMSTHQWNQHGIRKLKKPDKGMLKKCLFCDYACPSASELELHNRSHTGERPFTCGGCGAKFSRLYNMRAHIRTSCAAAKKIGLADVVDKERRINKMKMGLTKTPEERIKPFKCSLCPQTFYKKLHIHNHMKRHGDQYKCGFCGVGYRNKRSLSQHTTMAHPEKVGGVQCNLCGKFLKAVTLRQHYLHVHEVDVDLLKGDKRRKKVPPTREKNVNIFSVEEEDPLGCVSMETESEKVGLLIEEVDVEMVQVGEEEELHLIDEEKASMYSPEILVSKYPDIIIESILL